MKKSVDRFFEAMDAVNLFTFSGGEPLMHPQLPELVRHCSRYIDHIEKFESITNGTIVPSEQLLENLKFSDKVDIMVDDYGENLSRKIPQIKEALGKNSIKYRVRKYYGEDAYMGGWVDTVDFSQKNRTRAQIAKHFSRCNYTTVFKNNFLVFEDTAHICYVNHKVLDWVQDDGTQYVKLHDENISPQDLRTRLETLRDRDYLSACIDCNGFMTEAERFTPAEQL
jgi:organic radical activating enzyme